ncbi:NHL repeat-containing protein [candidate division KSB1 bacterium]|nr:NHL repeat-containing protein [candidate division KSB1 bacterium]
MTTQTILTLIYLFTFGQQPIDHLLLADPQAMHVDINHAIYVADTGNNRILKFREDGTLLKAIGGFGWDKEQFDIPNDVCAGTTLDVFVADYNNQRIERYDKDLHFISSFYSDENQPTNLTFGYPRGVTVSRHGELVIVDSENNRLLKINSFGQPELSFGDFAEGRGKLDEPMQVDISSDDRIYVSDRAGNRIVVFDYFGNYLGEIGTSILDKPKGLSVDAMNRIWVTDAKHIYTFNGQGEKILEWERIGKDNFFQNPADIIVFKNRICVLENNGIHVFELIESAR